MHNFDDEDGIYTEIRALIDELQNDADRLNKAAIKSGISEDILRQIAALADKIDGLGSLAR